MFHVVLAVIVDVKDGFAPIKLKELDIRKYFIRVVHAQFFKYSEASLKFVILVVVGIFETTKREHLIDTR